MTTTSNLQSAASAGDAGSVRHLLEGGADVDVRGAWGVTPLMAAASRGHTEIVRLLLEYGADPMVWDESERPSSPLLDAIRNHHPDAVREIARRINPDACSWGLPFAVLSGDLPTVEALLDCGANPDAAASSDGRTPLMHAVAAQRYDLVELLLRRGAAINQPDRCTPLMLAVLLRHSSMAERLLDAGADPDVADREGRTALSLAQELGDERLVNLLTARASP
jgi:ankyrin repeat protein